MTRNNYFVRLVKRKPRSSRALLVLAAVAGLFMAMWSGSASAGSEGRTIMLKTEHSRFAGNPLAYWVKICGLNNDMIPTCSEWKYFKPHTYDFANPFEGFWFQGKVTICIGDTAFNVRVDRKLDHDDYIYVDLSREPFSVERPEAPTLCDL